MVRRSGAWVIGAILCLTLINVPARGSFHLWQIDEVYSNASGTVQFVELFDEFDGEEFVGGFTLNSNANSFTFNQNLPSSSTANHHMLIGTPAYAALSGVPAPDYTFPVNNFFNTGGDTLNYASSTNTLTFTSGQLPVNGSNSLNRAYNQSTFFTAVNSPTNFAGASGTVPEPAAIGLLALGIIPLLRRSRRA